MLSDIIAFILAITGTIFILFTIIFKLMLWKEQDVNISLPLYYDDKEIFDRITNLREICCFLGIQKKCTIVVVDYGASDLFTSKLKSYFSEYSFIKIIKAENLIKELHT